MTFEFLMTSKPHFGAFKHPHLSLSVGIGKTPAENDAVFSRASLRLNFHICAPVTSDLKHF